MLRLRSALTNATASFAAASAASVTVSSSLSSSSSRLCEARRTFLGQEERSEADRSGPRRVPSMDKSGRLYDPSIFDEERLMQERDAQNRAAEAEMGKMREAYGRFGASTTVYPDAGKASTNRPTHGAAHSGNIKVDQGVAKRMDQMYDEYVGGERYNSSASGTYEQSQGIQGSIHDRENLRVRGQKVPDDVPVTDAEVDAHPAARRMRTFGVGAICIVLYVAGKAMRDPFDEGEKFSRYRCKPDGNDRELMPWLMPRNGAGSDGDLRQALFHKGLEEAQAVHVHGNVFKASKATSTKPW